MDARERLRRFLEQRRDMGERELLLDSMSVDDVMRVLGASRSSAAPSVSGATVGKDASDWRSTLRAADASAAQPVARDTTATEPIATPAPIRRADFPPPPTSISPLPSASPLPASSSAPIAPPGIVIGAAGRELFRGPIAELDSLDAVAGMIAKCTACPLYLTARNPVPGEGSATAPLVCVGEAPGETEDATGLPFVGAAGQLLTKILAAIDLKREDVFICNVLKHRPPGNRNPRPEEVAACSPYLVRQLELIRPKVIVAFGTFAAQTLLDTNLALGKLRGMVHQYYGTPLVVTYHPAALLRNPSWKRPTWEDIQLARRILDRPTPIAGSSGA